MYNMENEMTDIELGGPIDVNDRPEWLNDNEMCKPCWGDDYWYHGISQADCVSGWDNVTKIRLRADHPKYKEPEQAKAIDAGYQLELEELRAFKARALELHPDLGPETPGQICHRILGRWVASGNYPMDLAETAFEAGREYERNNV